MTKHFTLLVHRIFPILLLIGLALGQGGFYLGDVTNDGLVNVFDVIALSQIILYNRWSRYSSHYKVQTKSINSTYFSQPEKVNRVVYA